mmetsp:Transcript_65219/g.74963  ORF Transcript_65219/g.74963 Transcript_65219/m.74963 type:complete len:86 (+) Transcript_65219:1981-2238(+)
MHKYIIQPALLKKITGNAMNLRVFPCNINTTRPTTISKKTHKYTQIAYDPIELSLPTASSSSQFHTKTPFCFIAASGPQSVPNKA